MYNDLKAAAKELVDATKLNGAGAELENQQAAKADSLIDAIGKVNKKSGPAIQAARSYYDSLSDTVKAKVTKLSVLEAAEAKFAKLSNSNATVIILAVAAVVIVGAAVTVIVIRKKKSSAEE
jgi:pantothenate kinase